MRITLLLILLAIGLLVLGVIGMRPGPVIVEWTTATELNTAGFNLYRSENAAGPFVKINEQMIPASSDSLVGGKYRFEDTTVMPGKTYYYQLEDVEYGGITTRHGPLVVTVSGGFGIEQGLLFFAGIISAACAFGLWLRNSKRLAWKEQVQKQI